VLVSYSGFYPLVSQITILIQSGIVASYSAGIVDFQWNVLAACQRRSKILRAKARDVTAMKTPRT
jgi:hypothetical protein